MYALQMDMARLKYDLNELVLGLLIQAWRWQQL